MKSLNAILTASILVLGGCSSILTSNEPAPTIYSLRAANSAATPAPRGASRVIEIQHPVLPPGFNTTQIAMYLDGGRRLDYFSGAQWPAPLDETLREFSDQTARMLLPDAIIATPGQSIDMDYRLQIRINDFQPVYAGNAITPPLLVANVTFTLLSMPGENIVTNFNIRQELQASANNLGAVTGGLQTLLQSVEDSAFGVIRDNIRKSGRTPRIRSSPEVPL